MYIYDGYYIFTDIHIVVSAKNRITVVSLINDGSYFTGDEEVEETTPRRDGTEENSLESDEDKRVEVKTTNDISFT